MRLLTYILIFVIWHIQSLFSDDFGTDYCPYMSLMTSSKDSIIYVNIETYKFYVTIHSEHNGSECAIPFNEYYVCGLSIGKNQNSTKQWFIYWGYDEDYEKYYLRTVYFFQITSHKCTYNYTDTIHLNKESPIFQMGYDGFTAFGFDYNMSYFYDIQLNKIFKILPITGSLAFTPCDMSLTKTNNEVIVVGYLKDGNDLSSLMYATVCLWKLNWINYSINILNCTTLHDTGYHFNKYHPRPKLSIDINNKNTNLFVIGNSANQNIEIFSFDNIEMTNIRTFKSHTEINSVCWLSDGYRIAVVAHLIPTLPWSQSQIQFYNLNLTTHNWPEYIFPNNQQQLDIWNYKNPAFILVSSWSQWNSLLILMNTQKILIILSTISGSYADPLLYSWFDNPWIWIGLRNKRQGEQFATPCWPGMYKNEDNIIPCKVCPPQTKSQANATICTLCNSSSFCSLAAVTDTDINNMIDISEETSYPQSSGSLQFEDILLTNMFSINNSSDCILISPLFWTLIAVSFVILILLIIGILKFFPRIYKRRTDFIGYGEFWIGGLMSFSLLVLLIFAFLFSNEYVNLYPIEQSNNPKMACDRTLRNSHFDTSLKFLTSKRSIEDQIIFEMLDKQSFTLIINFVNTNFGCDLLDILEGTGLNLHEPISTMKCIALTPGQIIHTSIPSSHQVTFKYRIKHFAPIGGLYICLMGNGSISEDGRNILRDMRFCKWIARENETIGFLPEITLLNTKIINRTANLIQNGPTKSSGVWQTTFIGLELSDQLLYNRQGEYHRYLNTETVLTIVLTEDHFYVENKQQPIARRSEANFHTILFMSLSLEMFCLIFLTFKLMFAPLFRLIERRILLYFRVTPITDNENKCISELVQVPIAPPSTVENPIDTPSSEVENSIDTPQQICTHLQESDWE